ncbi:nucleoside diphosphate-linked moiety X motif 19 [Drosophila novamexicana]|uniref:nucleoside diphosphate-linked moiety X motif 19 n=1 Tax=Drosophila novamexicana TaxID=47314 RepID=UPI0011E5E7BE|nr:nucleoside diphosphate-linked moiety X motif 19 [Drosophila novamexicana]XP_030569724.1 nucleoside diphosphate-linked moiety X motif 19 [Drosophila novamexicana]
MATSDKVRVNGYRPSASLILAGKAVSNSKAQFDYNLLLIKRTERTSYALNHCVFPGGVFDANADESADWLTYFQHCGITQAQLELLKCRQATGRPELLSRGVNFSRDISLRLTALRETFEEVGILLCCKSLKDLDKGQPAHVLLQPLERELWQQRVHDDATQFLELCRHLSVIPDLWALSEWSVWRTPASASRKYDTVYYFAALETSQVDLLLEPTEVASAHWLHPGDCWQQSQEGTIWLPFILLYETARLMSMHCWEQLLQFAHNRSARGSTLLQPIYYRTTDCLLGVLPGDELYLAKPENCTESIILPSSINELNALAKRYNRYMIYGFERVDFACNVLPLNGHLPLHALVNTRLAKL